MLSSALELRFFLELASLPDMIRGFGHVKLANLALARAKWQDLRQRWDAGESRLPQRDSSSQRDPASTPAA